ncbi:MAG: DNA-processing protein DprA [Deltaproteobacteria bacterium]|nr:DNA-processing protein DprA [Deltaproteobacteria bacterium]
MTDKLPWLALKCIPGVGPVLFQRLLARFGTPAAVFQARCEDVLGIKGVNRDLARDILGFRAWDRVEAELAKMAKEGVEVLLQTDPRFPARLKQIPYAPPLLFLKGTLLPQDDLALAVVGTRAASYYGLKTCRRLAGALAVRGVTVVSGLARGIDTAAHQGAMENSGRTLAVLGCGLDVVYPPENQKLYVQIPAQGALISEFPLGTPPEAKNFPIRNRIISGLSLGVVVVEAGLKSGTGITVRYALDQGREVFAVPGPIDSPTSLGPHRLIQDGAKLVQDPEDIFSELPGLAKGKGQRPLFGAPGRVKETPAAGGGGPTPATIPPAAPPFSPTPEDPLLALLGSDPLPLEEIVRTTRLATSEVLSRLTILELEGLIRELPGKRYVLEN